MMQSLKWAVTLGCSGTKVELYGVDNDGVGGGAMKNGASRRTRRLA
jgi:hypothetical protein